MADEIRVGAVQYLNAQPLYECLTEIDPRVRLSLDHPSVLAAQLAADRLDVALIPSVEYLRGIARAERYEVVPGVGIATRGAVRSVKLLSRVALSEIKSLALDEGSRTSQVLAQVWLAEAHGTRPRTVSPLPIGCSPLEATADAVVVIGDRAMTVPESDFSHAVDLGQAWLELTGLPFVFAFWVCRDGARFPGLTEVFAQARDLGLARARTIASEASRRLGLDPEFCYRYLTENLCHTLREPEIAGFRLFAAKAAALGLAPEGAPLVFARSSVHSATHG